MENIGGVKMASQLHLILLVTSILALDYKESIKGTLAVRLPVHSIFRWGPLFSDGIGLRWDPEEFNASHGDLIITAVATSGSKSEVTDGANLNEGAVTLMGLTPNSSYLVTATANISENNTLVLRKTIHTPANGTKPPPFYFDWEPVTNESIHLSWDYLDPEDISNVTITMTAKMASNLSVERSASALVDVGEVTVDGLEPNTLYIVTATALKDGQQFFNSTREIRTLETGRKEVTVVTTSASAIASAILELLLTCMALVLA